MRGTIQQRGSSSWRLRVHLGRDGTGRKRYASRTVRGSRREAERELNRFVSEVIDGRLVASPVMTFDVLLDRWLEVKRQAVELSTHESYAWIARTYLRPRVGARKLETLRAVDLDMMYVELGGQGLSPRTVQLCHTVMRQSLEQARRWGLISRNPAVDASPPANRRREVEPPTIDQVLELVNTALREDEEFGVYLWVLAATGCRRGEVCALRWNDFDLDRAELRVRRSVVHLKGEVREKDTKTHQSRRLALDEATITLLRQHLLRLRERVLALGAPLADDALLFNDSKGRPWRPDMCTKRFGRLRTDLGMKGVRLHDLRHFVASVLVDGGIAISTVSTRLGHSQISTTLNLYTHAIPATDQRAADLLGNLLTGSA